MGRVQQLEHGGLSTCRWTVVRGYLRPGYVAHVEPRDAQRRRPLGAVFRPAGLRDHAPINFSLDNFRKTCAARSPQRAGRVSVPRGSRLPSGKDRANTQWWNLSPRVGVAWDVTGDGRMSVRSSYSLAYDFQRANTTSRRFRIRPSARAIPARRPGRAALTIPTAASAATHIR